MAEALLCLDVGNSTVHWAYFEGKEQLAASVFQRKDDEALHALLKDFKGRQLAYCSVVPESVAPLRLAAENFGFDDLFELNLKNLKRLKVSTQNPQEVGSDRLANALGALCAYRAPAIIVDLGTATTVDLISAQETYVGGAIAPGLSAMTHYLQNKTALLPSFDLSLLSKEPPLIGKTTLQAMQLGLQKGYPAMILALVASARKALKALGNLSEPIYLLTGGAPAQYFKKDFEDFVYVSDLSLVGLREAYRLATKD